MKLCSILRPRRPIYVVNESTVVADAAVRKWCTAVAWQLRRDVAPAWSAFQGADQPKSVRLLGSTSNPPAGAWVVAVLDDADQAGALGYHSTDDLGRTYGRVFAKTCMDYGVNPSTTFSHEVLEMWGDPTADKWSHNDAADWDTPLELCDAVEGGSYTTRGVEVSNFLYPAWFNLTTGQEDHLDRLAGSFSLDTGGYMVIRDKDGTTRQVFGRTAKQDYVRAKSGEMSRVTRRTQ